MINIITRKSLRFLLLGLLFLGIFSNGIAQETGALKQIPGTPCKDCKGKNNIERSGGNAVQNGNASVATSYTAQACGLNWTQGSVVIEQRTIGVVASPPPGIAQPAPILISGIPACATIVKAFLYCDASGNGIPITATVTNPGGGSSNFPMTIIGQDVDKCWSGLGYAATYSYRADVTAIVTTNGTYQVAGLPVNPPTPGPNDVDGATLFIIYSDPSQTYTGAIVLADGAHVSIGTSVSDLVTGFNTCAASAASSAFILIADLQGISNTSLVLNGTAATESSTNDAWWNFISTPSSVTAGQTTSSFSASNAGDCFNVVLAGFYYQTACSTCIAAGSLTVTATASLPCSPTTSATATAVGGSGNYSYLWSGGQNTQTITGVAAGIYTVTVTDNSIACTIGTATVNIPGLVAPSIVVNSGTVCLGSATTLTVSGATTYTWSPGTGLSSTSASVVTSNPVATTIYTVSGTVGTCTTSSTCTVTVNPIPVVTVNNASFCFGFGATLNAMGAASYSWGPAAGLNTTNLASVNCTATISTNYTVTGTTLGCSDSAVAVVTVMANPTLTINSDSICLGQQTANLVVAGANTYTWTPAAGLSSPNNPSVVANPNVTTSYTVFGQGIDGCLDTISTTVVVLPIPVIIVNSGTLCIGQQTATLNASGANIYNWSPTTGLNTASGPTVIANPIVTSTYFVSGTDVHGCISASPATVTVNSLPILTVNTGTVCSGKPVKLIVSGASSYIWSPSAGLNTVNGATVTSNPASLQDYTVQGTDLHGCTQTATTQVVVNQNPIASFTPINASGCVPLCVNFNNTGSAGTCTWTFGDGGSAVANSTTNCYQKAGFYNVELYVVNAFGCVDSTYGTVNAYPIPKANFTYLPNQISILAPSVQFVNQSGSAVITSWNWNFGDYSPIDSLESPKHTYQDTGNYVALLTVISDHGCRDSIIEIIRVEPDYELFVPNAFTPNGDGLNEIFLPEGDGIVNYKLHIYDRWGNLLFSSYDINTGWDGKFQNKGGDILQEDVYVWKIDLTDFKQQGHTVSGHVSLIK